MTLDWHEKLKMLKFSFPVNVESPVATYETPYGNIIRTLMVTKIRVRGGSTSVEKEKTEFTGLLSSMMQNMVTVSMGMICASLLCAHHLLHTMFQRSSI